MRRARNFARSDPTNWTRTDDRVERVMQKTVTLHWAIEMRRHAFSKASVDNADALSATGSNVSFSTRALAISVSE